MKKFYSLSQFPGNTGKYFYTEFFKYYNFNGSYCPLGTNDFEKSFFNILSESSGISISMPFKKTVINYLTEKDKSVIDYDTCNTVLIESSNIKGYNCDLEGVRYVSKFIENYNSVCILGNGCMGSMFYKFLNNKNKEVISRSLNNWDRRHENFDVFINCTSLGTSLSKSPLNYLPKSTKLIIDLALKTNELQQSCTLENIKYINGLAFYKAQFLKQFEIYTDICPDDDYFDFIYQKMNQ